MVVTRAEGNFMLCQPSREVPADCAPAEEVSSYDLLWDTFGVSGDIFGDFWATMVCGPVESITDECCYVLTDFEYMEWAEGRPFTVDGHARLAECGSPNGWAQAIDWNPPALAPALHEQWSPTGPRPHSSSTPLWHLSRFSMQLMAIGAPAGLIAEATRAQSDGIRHARIALGIASTLSGEELGLASLPIDGALAGASDVRSILVDTIHEACVNETVSAAQCQAAGEASNDPFIKEALLTIAEDEQRHPRWLGRRSAGCGAHPECAASTEAFESAIAKPWGSTEQRGSERVNGESCRPSPTKPSLVACYDRWCAPVQTHS